MTGHQPDAMGDEPPPSESEPEGDPTTLDPLEERSRAYHGLVVAERALAVFLLAALFVTVLLQVFTRYVLDLPLPWTEEIARYLLIWTTFIAAAYVGARRLHISVDLLVSKLRRTAATVVDVVSQVVVVATCAVLAAGASTAAYQLADVTSPATNTPMWVVYGSAVLGFGLIGVHACFGIYMDLRYQDAAPDAFEGIERGSAF